MESLLQLCEELGDLSMEECQLILDNPQDPAAETMPMAMSKEVMDSVLTKLKCIGDDIPKDSAILSDLKRLCAYAIYNVLNGVDNEAKLLAARIVIAISSLPSASAFGVLNSNVVHTLLNTVNKIIGAELKSTQKGASKSTASKNALNLDIQLNEEEPELSQSSASQRSSQRLSQASQESESEEETVEHDPFEARGTSRTQAATALANRDKLKPQQLSAFIGLLSLRITIFSSQSDEYILNASADLLVSIMYLCAIRAEFSGSAVLCQRAIVRFGTTNRAAMITMYRSLMPILTMAARNHMLPDDFKVKRNCHKCALNVMVELMKSFQVDALIMVEAPEASEAQDSQPVDGQRTTDVPASAPGSPMSPSEDRRSSTGSTSSVASAVAKASPAVVLPLAHTCLIGVLQRMMLAPPDRAPVRQLLLVSLVEIISVLGRDLAADPEAHVSQVLPVLQSLEHYLAFLSRLSKSSKVAHRSFSLDITAQLLSTAWLWTLPSSVTLMNNTVDVAEGIESPCHVLLNVLQDRCTDFSPAARTRALSAIHELLQSLDKNSASSMMQALLDAAMGAKPVRSERSTGSSEEISRMPLIEILRERTTDDKPQVRTKALAALGLALCMPWPKPVADGKVETITMLVSEEDLEVFAAHTRDASLSVRKQAMVSLTELLRARPADALIQDMWVQSVIPMTFDPESGVSNKVAESLHALLFDNLVAWYQDQQTNRRGGVRTEASIAADLERSEHISLVWRLSAKITHMGMFKILKAVLGIMVRQNYLSAAPATRGAGNSASLLGVIAALKFACCYHLSGDAHDADPSQGSVQKICRTCDPEEIARGAWILLEGLVSLEQMSILNAKQESVKFRDFIRQAGSADFVVRCYRQKHPDGVAVVWDEEDLRIFKVLEILGGNLTEQDSVYMKHQLEDNLQQMQCECHIAAAAIAVMLQLSKASLAEASSAQVDSSKLLKESVSKWTAPLLASVQTILHTYAFRTRPAGLTHSIEATSTLGQLLQDWLAESHHSNADASLTMDVSAVLGHSSDTHASLTAHVLEAVQSALFVLGEISMLGFSMEEDHFLGNNQSQKKKASESSASAKSAEQFRLTVDDSIVDLVKILMGHALPVTNTAGVSSMARECPNKVRANAFVTMGKLCMRNKTLAREHVNIFLREVSLSATNNHANGTNNAVSTLGAHSHSSTAAAAVRSNALLVLGDMCIRYTNLVDRHVDTMAQCLQDTDSLVRKNALILLTQLLLQDFLKWKGFLLYRFLVLTVDSDGEIAEFSRNILQKTLSLKYPQLLTNHFTEAMVILNGCTAHPAYASIARTGTVADGDAEITMLSTQDATEEDHSVLPEVSFSANLTKTQRFGVYAFMAENMDDETKIQVSAKLVQDVLSAAVDSTTLLPQPSNKGAANNNKKADKDKYAPFENVLEDALTLLRSPHLKVGQKKGGADDGDDLAEEDPADATAGSNAANPKAAFARAKSKVLQKLSTQHLVSHTLPVVISLKHTLEASKSALQGTLMEFLVALVKHHKNEVEEALQFDPTLRSEIEYDLKQFERAKKDKLVATINAQASARKSPHFPSSVAAAPGTASRLSFSSRKSLSPYLDLQTLPAQSIVKPSLRKSLGGQASRGRTPYDALKSPGMHLARSAIRSALSNTTDSKHAVEEDNNDDVDRLTFSQVEAGAAGPQEFSTMDASSTDDMQMNINCPTQVLFQDDDNTSSAAFGSSKKNRRSWGVVVNSLLPAEGFHEEGMPSILDSVSGSGKLVHSPLKERTSPPKKKRCRKSTTPTKPVSSSNSGTKAVSFEKAGVKAEISDMAEPDVVSKALFASENLAPAENLPMQKPSSQPVKNRGGSSRGGAMVTNSLATLAAASIHNVSLQDDAAVNAFDRLLASTSVSAAPVVSKVKAAPVAAPSQSRAGKRGGAQQTNSLLNL
eukprot:gene13832-15908_t